MAESDNLIATLARSGRMRIAAALLVTALVGGGLGVIMLRGESSSKALLFSGLDLEEAADIAGKLDTANVRYWLEGGGSAIFVPRSSVDEARMMLSEQGLPTRGSVGWEIFDRSDALGATSFVQNINKTRALEGELARSIASLGMVKAARVHLALPDRPLFQRDTQQPTASVLLQLTGASMTPEKVRAIQNLVASSVPGLNVSNVTVTDDKGRMLAAGGTGDESAAGGIGADERQLALEQGLRNKVFDIVENIAGPGAAKVTVSMDVNFNRVTQTSERFNPDERVVRSSSTSENVTARQEPRPGDEATVANNIPTGAGATPNALQSSENVSSTTETVNYEISKEVRTEATDGSQVRRLSVAVVVDHQRIPGVDGAPATFEPRAPEEIARILTLVKSAVGFDEARGDVVTVENLPFARPDTAMDGALAPGPFDFDKFDIVRAGEIAALLITALMLVLFVLRPLVKGLMSPKEGAGTGAMEGPLGANRALGNAGALSGGDPGSHGGGAERQPMTIDVPTPDRFDAGIDVARIHGQVKASSIKKISEVVSSHPDESLAIIRSWLAEESKERAA